MKVRHSIVQLMAPKLYERFIVLAKIRESLPRPMIHFAYSYFKGKPVTGVEIGAAEGLHAQTILKSLNIKKLFLIDPYMPYFEVKTDGKDEVKEYIDCLPLARARLAKYKKKTVFITKFSEEATDLVPDNLDFVYIDGNHSYESVKKDIALYYPKIKVEGLLGGHDFAQNFSGVINAVEEFAEDHHYDLHQKLRDWWIVKV